MSAYLIRAGAGVAASGYSSETLGSHMDPVTISYLITSDILHMKVCEELLADGL